MVNPVRRKFMDHHLGIGVEKPGNRIGHSYVSG